MSKIVTKIRSLIDLAVNAGTSDEARNAALQAVRLMRKHELEVVSKVAAEVLEKLQSHPEGEVILRAVMEQIRGGGGGGATAPNMDAFKETIIRAGGKAIGDVASTLIGQALKRRR